MSSHDRVFEAKHFFVPAPEPARQLHDSAQQLTAHRLSRDEYERLRSRLQCNTQAAFPLCTYICTII